MVNQIQCHSPEKKGETEKHEDKDKRWRNGGRGEGRCLSAVLADRPTKPYRTAGLVARTSARAVGRGTRTPHIWPAPMSATAFYLGWI